MKTPENVRKREAERKARKRRENRRRLRKLKQLLYFTRTGRWVDDPKRLHWHHTDPNLKTRKVCHLVTRSWQRIQEEIEHCIVLHEDEHLRLHGLTSLRTK